MDFKKRIEFSYVSVRSAYRKTTYAKKRMDPRHNQSVKRRVSAFLFCKYPPPGIKDPFSVPLHLHAPPIFCISASKYCLQPYTADFFFYNYTVLLFVTVYQKKIYLQTFFPFSPAFCFCTSISSFLPLPTCLPLPPLVHLYLQTGLPPASLLCKSDRQE